MIRAIIRSKTTGRRTLLLGLDRENLDRLANGKPIYVIGKALGVDCDVAIVFGESLSDVINDM